MGENYYLEGRGELPLMGDEKPSLDVGFGRKIKGNLSAEVQASFGSRAALRAGVRRQLK